MYGLFPSGPDLSFARLFVPPPPPLHTHTHTSEKVTGHLHIPVVYYAKKCKITRMFRKQKYFL